MDIHSELKGAQLEVRETDYTHSANERGRIWFNKAVDKIKASFNGVIESLATESWVTTKDSELKTELEAKMTTDRIAKAYEVLDLGSYSGANSTPQVVYTATDPCLVFAEVSGVNPADTNNFFILNYSDLSSNNGRSFTRVYSKSNSSGTDGSQTNFVPAGMSLQKIHQGNWTVKLHIIKLQGAA